MTMISDISQDLLEEVLYRVPVTSLRALRSTCKRWNDISKDPSFSNKYGRKRANEFLVIMLKEFRACLMNVNLHRLHDKKHVIDLSIKQIGELNQVNISRVFHCDGLLLCVIYDEDNTRLVVWNPYLGQTRWIQPINKFGTYDWYAIGYDKKNNKKNHKILRFFYRFRHNMEYQIYNFLSKSWRVHNITSDWSMPLDGGLCLMGNSYFLADKINLEVEDVEMEEFLVCFDFTKERFGPLLPLPFHYSIENAVILSTVREEQLAVLSKRCDAYETKIWITRKIEPNGVSWSNFLKLDFKFDLTGGSLFVDKEEKVAVIRCLFGDQSIKNTAYVIGEDGYYKEVDLGESNSILHCSYVPSCLQVQ